MCRVRSKTEPPFANATPESDFRRAHAPLRRCFVASFSVTNHMLSKIRNSKPHTPNLKLQTLNPKTQNSNPKTLTPKLKSQSRGAPLLVERAPTSSTPLSCLSNHPGVKLRANLKSISHRCHLFEVAFVWELTTETNNLLLGCLQRGVHSVTNPLAPMPKGGGVRRAHPLFGRFCVASSSVTFPILFNVLDRKAGGGVGRAPIFFMPVCCLSNVHTVMNPQIPTQKQGVSGRLPLLLLPTPSPHLRIISPERSTLLQGAVSGVLVHAFALPFLLLEILNSRPEAPNEGLRAPDTQS